MKLFQRLLVAPAALGLLAPISANANEVNLNEISNYSDVEGIEFANSFDNDVSTENFLLAGGEGLMDDHDHGSEDSFSSTTSASFSVDFAIGSESGNDADGNATDGSSEAIGTAYGYQIDLSTSFTGEDVLSVSLDAGAGAGALSELDLNSTSSDGLVVDGITYSFPLGEKMTVLVGDSTDGSALYSTACVYGGITNTLDDCGNYGAAFTSPTDGAALSASYDIGNGYTAAVGYAGQGSGSSGLMTKEGTDYYGAQLSYAGDNYGASVTYGNLETQRAWALNGYFTFDDSSMPSLSVGYESTDNEGTIASQSQWFAGLQWDEIGPGTLGVAAGTKGPQSEGATDDEMAYEAFYAYPVNDSMTITPAIYLLENTGTNEDDETGFVVKTSFSF